MATRETTTDERRFETSQRTSRPTVTREETKASFLTTEFWAMLGVIAAILVAAQQADNFDAPRAWTLVAAVAIGYMVSRGLAKSGTAYRDRDRLGSAPFRGEVVRGRQRRLLTVERARNLKKS